ERQKDTQQAQKGDEDGSKTRRAYDSAKAILKGQEQPESSHDPYPSSNRNTNGGKEQQPDDNGEQEQEKPKQDGATEKTATETVAGSSDPREKRKAMKKMKRNDGGREVTDPVTHLPVTIYDATPKDLKGAPENEAATGEL
ncbi:MAG: hypothetical protein M1823_008886, partial [Watsoniomyces obsoletus]